MSFCAAEAEADGNADAALDIAPLGIASVDAAGGTADADLRSPASPPAQPNERDRSSVAARRARNVTREGYACAREKLARTRPLSLDPKLVAASRVSRKVRLDALVCLVWLALAACGAEQRPPGARHWPLPVPSALALAEDDRLGLDPLGGGVGAQVVLRNDLSRPSAVRFSPDGAVLAIADQEPSFVDHTPLTNVHLFDTSTWRQRWLFSVGRGRVSEWDFSADSRFLYVRPDGSTNADPFVFDLHQPGTFRAGSAPELAPAERWSLDPVRGYEAAIVRDQPYVRITDTRTGDRVTELGRPRARAHAVVAHERGVLFLAALDQSGELGLWDGMTGRSIPFESARPPHIHTFAISTRGQLVLSTRSGELWSYRPLADGTMAGKRLRSGAPAESFAFGADHACWFAALRGGRVLGFDGALDTPTGLDVKLPARELWLSVYDDAITAHGGRASWELDASNGALRLVDTGMVGLLAGGDPSGSSTPELPIEAACEGARCRLEVAGRELWFVAADDPGSAFLYERSRYQPLGLPGPSRPLSCVASGFVLDDQSCDPPVDGLIALALRPL